MADFSAQPAGAVAAEAEWNADGLAICRSADSVPLPILSAVLAQSDDCIKVIATDGRLLFMSRNGQGAMEIGDFSRVSNRFWWELWPAASEGQLRAAVEAGRAGRTSRLEAFCPTAKGTPKWWDVTVSPVLGDDGRVSCLVATSRDITTHAHDRERLSVVAQEMRHRVKNAFAISAAMTKLFARQEPEHQAFAASVAERLQTLATVQSALMDRHSDDDGPSAILDAVFAAFQADNCDVDTSGVPAVTVSSNVAQTLGLVFGEFATNSLKHGALGAGGRIAVHGNAEGGQLHLRWDEERASSAEKPLHSGQAGMSIIERMVAVMGGKISHRVTDSGFHAELSLPLK